MQYFLTISESLRHETCLHWLRLFPSQINIFNESNFSSYFLFQLKFLMWLSKIFMTRINPQLRTWHFHLSIMMAPLQIISDGINFRSRERTWDVRILRLVHFTTDELFNNFHSSLIMLCFLSQTSINLRTPDVLFVFEKLVLTLLPTRFIFISIRSPLDKRKVSRCLPYHKTYWHGSWEKGRRNNEKAHEKLYHRLSTEWQQEKNVKLFPVPLFGFF